jgi:hypothetical protein
VAWRREGSMKDACCVACHGGINGKLGERLRFGLTTWIWVHRERGGADLWSLRTRRFVWNFPGVNDGGGRGTMPCLFL